MRKLFDAFPDNAHPRGHSFYRRAVSVLSAFYFDHLDLDLDEVCIKYYKGDSTIVAFSYRYSQGLPIIFILI